MKKPDTEGLKLEYLENLVFYDDLFIYKDQEYSYNHICHIEYTATVTKRSVNFIPTGTSYQTNLRLHMSNKEKIDIRQADSFLGLNEKQKAEAVMKASAILHEITFTSRIEKYEKELNQKSFISWGNYQFGKNGDFFKNNIFLFNLKNDNVRKSLDVFTFIAGKKATNFKEKISKLWKHDENVDISTDKDCFLYYMKNYLGFTWAKEPVKEKRKPHKEELFEAIIVLGAKVCKADGHVAPEEILTFKRYFGIDGNTFPEASKVFSNATNSSKGLDEAAQKIYNLFDGKTEALEHLIIGLLQIAAADGVITSDEKSIIKNICTIFKFPKNEIERLFLIFEHVKEKQTNRPSSGARLEYLKILGVAPEASHEEIKSAYKELVRKHHPDILMSQGLPLERIKDSEEVLKTINIAYTWLCKEYDREKNKAA